MIINDSAVNFIKYINSKYLIVYLYNSFQGETLESVLQSLSNYQHLLIYIDPQEDFRLKRFNYDILARKKGKYKF
mgnify:CR=1 FL=1